MTMHVTGSFLMCLLFCFTFLQLWVLNPEPCACQATAPPLSSTPARDYMKHFNEFNLVKQGLISCIYSYVLPKIPRHLCSYTHLYSEKKRHLVPMAFCQRLKGKQTDGMALQQRMRRLLRCAFLKAVIISRRRGDWANLQLPYMIKKWHTVFFRLVQSCKKR